MPELTSATPYIEVFDMNSSIAFYLDVLGFIIVSASPQIKTREGRFSHFVRLRRDRVELMLNTAYDPNERPASRSEPRWSGTQHYHLCVDCEDVATLYAALIARGLEAVAPARTGYGYLGFSVSDPDGYGLTFHQPL